MILLEEHFRKWIRRRFYLCYLIQKHSGKSQKFGINYQIVLLKYHRVVILEKQRGLASEFNESHTAQICKKKALIFPSVIFSSMNLSICLLNSDPWNRNSPTVNSGTRAMGLLHHSEASNIMFALRFKVASSSLRLAEIIWGRGKSLLFLSFL